MVTHHTVLSCCYTCPSAVLAPLHTHTQAHMLVLRLKLWSINNTLSGECVHTHTHPQISTHAGCTEVLSNILIGMSQLLDQPAYLPPAPLLPCPANQLQWTKTVCPLLIASFCVYLKLRVLQHKIKSEWPKQNTNLKWESSKRWSNTNYTSGEAQKTTKLINLWWVTKLQGFTDPQWERLSKNGEDFEQ